MFKLNFVARTTSFFGLGIFLDSIEHDFIRIWKYETFKALKKCLTLRVERTLISEIYPLTFYLSNHWKIIWKNLKINGISHPIVNTMFLPEAKNTKDPTHNVDCIVVFNDSPGTWTHCFHVDISEMPVVLGTNVLPIITLKSFRNSPEIL